jgi:DNA-binding MarR family transcriptional regulator
MPNHAAVIELATELRLACMRISRRVRFESTDTLAPHHFSVLVRLEESVRTPRELAEIEKVSAPSMSRTIGGLEEDGLLTRTADPEDGRSVLVAITPAGRKAVAAAREQRNEWMSSRLAALTTEEREVLRRATAVLAKVAAS